MSQPPSSNSSKSVFRTSLHWHFYFGHVFLPTRAYGLWALNVWSYLCSLSILERSPRSIKRSSTYISSAYFNLFFLIPIALALLCTVVVVLLLSIRLKWHNVVQSTLSGPISINVIIAEVLLYRINIICYLSGKHIFAVTPYCLWISFFWEMESRKILFTSINLLISTLKRWNLLSMDMIS